MQGVVTDSELCARKEGIIENPRPTADKLRGIYFADTFQPWISISI
jgi:hypothetical protein